MNKTKRALLLGGTGAMGAHLARLLAASGWKVTVTSRSARSSDDPAVSYAKGNAHDQGFLAEMLAPGWDAVVDFMVWSTEAFRGVRDLLLASCSQYVYLSSYRVFADSTVIDERSPRLLEACGDAEYLATDEYALAKARQEDLLRVSGRGNWTVARPAVTYSRGRFQLCTLECDVWMPMAIAGHPVPLASEMLPKQATMSWGGDVALMISRLVGNPAALGEDFNVCTSKHRSWAEIAEVYQGTLPLEVKGVPLGAFERAFGNAYQCRYDRMFDRVMDNAKVLRATGLAESDLLGVDEGIPRELGPFLAAPRFRSAGKRQLGRLDRLGGGFFSPIGFSSLEGASPLGYAKYLAGRVLG